MAEYNVSIDNGTTIIESPESSFKISVLRDRKDTSSDVPVIEATIYKEEGGFIPFGNYFFEAIDKENKPVYEVSLDDFNNAVDFFFISIMNTELYVKSVPQTSTLFPQYKKLLRF